MRQPWLRHSSTEATRSCPAVLTTIMVPFDSRTPFTTSGIRVGTPAITSRGLVEKDMETIVELIDEVLSDVENEAVIEKVKNASHSLVAGRPLNVW